MLPTAPHRRIRHILAVRLLALCCLVAGAHGRAAEQAVDIALGATAAASAVAESLAGAEGAAAQLDTQVRFRGRQLFEVRAPYAQRDPVARARAIEARLLQVAAGPDSVLQAMQVVEVEGISQVRAGETVIWYVTDADALRTGRTRQQLAADALEATRAALAREFADRGTSALLRATLMAAATLLVLVALLVALVKLQAALRRHVSRAVARWSRERGTEEGRFLSPAVAVSVARSTFLASAWIIGILLVYLYLQYALSLFPWTRGIAAQMVAAIQNALRLAGTGFVEYLPSLIHIVVIVVLARLLLRMVRVFFNQIGSGRLHLNGFYAEWAQPTYALLRYLVIAIAAVLVFPYLPGFGSEGFKGISVFIGLLVSLGAASAIANVISGIVITYMRPFQVGDRVKIADALGDVTAKDLFVVRLRTIKNVDITIPNSLVLANHIINFSSSARSQGLILHTTVTISYDVPWPKVQALLIEAAGKVPLIEADPAPFVLQTALNDFSVAYELNVTTRAPESMAGIYSDLHAAIQDAFNAAGVEIMSPHFTAVRDGNQAAIPTEYLPKDYRRPEFGLRALMASGKAE